MFWLTTQQTPLPNPRRSCHDHAISLRSSLFEVSDCRPRANSLRLRKRPPRFFPRSLAPDAVSRPALAIMSNFRRAGHGPQENSILKTLQAAEMLDNKSVLPAGE